MRRRRHRGFTMIEIATVIGILVVLFTIAVGITGKMNQSFARSGAINNVASVLGEGRALAMERGHEVAVIFRQVNELETTIDFAMPHGEPTTAGVQHYRRVPGRSTLRMPEGFTVRAPNPVSTNAADAYQFSTMYGGAGGARPPEVYFAILFGPDGALRTGKPTNKIGFDGNDNGNVTDNETVDLPDVPVAPYVAVVDVRKLQEARVRPPADGGWSTQAGEDQWVAASDTGTPTGREGEKAAKAGHVKFLMLNRYSGNVLEVEGALSGRP